MKFNPLAVAILAFGVLVATPALAGGSNNGGGNGGNGGNGGQGGHGGEGGNANQGQAQGQGQGQAQGQAQGQLQGQAQGQGQVQGQGQAVVGSGNSAQTQGVTGSGNSAQTQGVTGSGNSAQGQTQGLNNRVGGQANSQSSSFVNNNATIYLPDRVNPLPTIDYGNTRIGDVSCPVPGILGGVSYSDGNYGLGGDNNFGNGNNSELTATLGFQIPLSTGGCRDEQKRIREERARRDGYDLVKQCLAMQQSNVTLDPTVFPEFNRCAGVNPVTVNVPQVPAVVPPAKW